MSFFDFLSPGGGSGFNLGGIFGGGGSASGMAGSILGTILNPAGGVQGLAATVGNAVNAPGILGIPLGGDAAAAGTAAATGNSPFPKNGTTDPGSDSEAWWAKNKVTVMIVGGVVVLVGLVVPERRQQLQRLCLALIGQIGLKNRLIN